MNNVSNISPRPAAASTHGSNNSLTLESFADLPSAAASERCSPGFLALYRESRADQVSEYRHIHGLRHLALPLHNRADPQSTATTDRFQPIAAVASLHLMKQGNQTHGTGGADGVTKGDP